MNYIQEINEFYDWLETHNPITKNAIGLWHALMHINNKSKWAKSFSTAMGTLEMKTGIKTSELYKARLELEERGLIKWRQRGGNQSAIYKLYPISHIAAAERNAAFADDLDDDYVDDNDDDNDSGYDEDADVDASDIDASDIDGSDGDASDGDASDNDASDGDGSDASNNDDALPKSADSACTTGESGGETSGNTGGNTKGSRVVSISKPNKTKGNKKKPNRNEGKSSLSPSERKIFNKEVLKIFKDYNRICLNMQPVSKKTDMRKSHVGARLQEHGMNEVQKMLKMAAASDFLAGINNVNWKANFDWLFLPTNFVKVLEGNYTNRSTQSNQPGSADPRNAGEYIGKPSHLQIIEETYQTLLNDGTFDY